MSSREVLHQNEPTQRELKKSGLRMSIECRIDARVLRGGATHCIGIENKSVLDIHHLECFAFSSDFTSGTSSTSDNLANLS